jgi:glycosyltransferase involved in cell wall biosynthesis
MRLSIIVPFFNAGEYLTKCLESILAQDLSCEEYEIVMVNDGSIDGSDLIAVKFANEYSNIRLISQQNKGAGGARNTGIQYARGQYIMFVDADDFLCSNKLKTLLDKLDLENLDALRFGYRNVNENYQVIKPFKHSGEFVDYKDEVTDGITFLTERLGYACYVPQFIFRSDLIKGGENLFREKIYFEDTEWIPRILMQAKRITSVDTIVFNYLLNAGSITQSIDKEKKRKVIQDKLLIIESIKHQMDGIKDNRWHKGMISMTVLSALDEVLIYYYNEYSTVITDIKEKDIFPLNSYHMNSRKKTSLFFLNLSPILYGIMRRIYLRFKSSRITYRPQLNAC